MPKNFEYVFAAYGLWVAGFGIYLLMLARKSARIRAALRRFASSGQS